MASICTRQKSSLVSTFTASEASGASSPGGGMWCESRLGKSHLKQVFLWRFQRLGGLKQSLFSSFVTSCWHMLMAYMGFVVAFSFHTSCRCQPRLIDSLPLSVYIYIYVYSDIYIYIVYHTHTHIYILYSNMYSIHPPVIKCGNKTTPIYTWFSH